MRASRLSFFISGVCRPEQSARCMGTTMRASKLSFTHVAFISGVPRPAQSARLQSSNVHSRSRFTVLVKGHADDYVAIVDGVEEEDSLPSTRSSSTFSHIRTAFVDALATIAASRIKVNDAEQKELRNRWLSAQTDSMTTGDLQPMFLGKEGVNDNVGYSKVRLTSPGFSFSAAGLLFPYHLGVGQCLIEHGFITGDTPLSGSSAGALVCAVIASGLSMEDAMLATKELASDCRKNGTAFRLGVVLRRYLQDCLPEDAHIKSSGRVRVAVTQVFRSPRALLVEDFFSKEDLVDALITSCFIPGYLAPRPVTVYRNRLCVDGGLTSFMPPTAAKSTVRVCAFPASQLGLKNIGISPDCKPAGRSSPRQLLSWALEPAADEVLDNLFDLGYQDALVWVSKFEVVAA